MPNAIDHVTSPVPAARIAAVVLALSGAAIAQPEGDQQPAPTADAASMPVDDRGERPFPDTPPEVHDSALRRLYVGGLLEGATLTDGWFGLDDVLGNLGITTTLNGWAVYQGNVRGGVERQDAVTGTLYWDVHFDLNRLAGLEGALVYTRLEAGSGDGVNDAVGGLAPVNDLARDDRVAVTHAWFEQQVLDGKLRFRIGKLEPCTDGFNFHGTTVAFDAMPYANFEGTQFLDLALINNTSVGFPPSAFGGMVFAEVAERAYVAGSVSAANTDQFALDLERSFGSRSEWMGIVEAGMVTPPAWLAGQYYAGWWYSGFEDAPDGTGIYAGGAQLIFREPGTERQGLGIFGRGGWAQDNPSGIEWFLSAGGQYLGLLPGRDDDVVGVGWAQSFTDGSRFSKPYEGVLEAYYRASVTRWLQVSPHVQWVVSPGSEAVSDAVTVGLRVQVSF